MNRITTALLTGLAISATSLLMGCAKPTSEVLVVDNINGYSFDTERQLFAFDSIAIAPVSYTHLTLPTICSV